MPCNSTLRGPGGADQWTGGCDDSLPPRGEDTGTISDHAAVCSPGTTANPPTRCKASAPGMVPGALGKTAARFGGARGCPATDGHTRRPLNRPSTAHTMPRCDDAG